MTHDNSSPENRPPESHSPESRSPETRPGDRPDLTPQLQQALQLINALCDDQITPEQFRELESLVTTDAQVRRLYVDMMHLHAGLYYFASAIPDMTGESVRLDEEDSPGGVESGMNETMVLPAMKPAPDRVEPSELFPPTPATDPVVKKSAHSRALYIKRGIAAMIAIGLGLLCYFLPQANSPSSDAFKSPIEKAPWYVADIDLAAKPVWETEPSHDGRFIAGESLVLQSGTVQLHLRHNGRLVVEGPADLRFISDTELRLNRGRIVARFPGGGLVVHCPTGEIRDLGTEFGVAVDARNGHSEVDVFEGRVSAAISNPASTQPSVPMVLKVGQAAVLNDQAITNNPQGAIPQRYICNLRNEKINSLDVTDLVSGGDGTTHRRGIAVDASTGEIGTPSPAPQLVGDGIYHRAHSLPVVDGAFVPDGSNGPSTVDSAGHRFQFPSTTNKALNQIWTGGQIPWPDTLGISYTIGEEDYSLPSHAIICTHSNNAITIDLDAVRRLYPDRNLTRFHCHVGNSYINGLKGAVKTNPIANVFVLIDGNSRFEKRSFSNQAGLFSVDLPLSNPDRFLTLASLDDGKDIDRDWILWTDAKLELDPAN